MLAIQKICIIWTKKDRSPQSAIERQKFIRPYKIKDNVSLDGEGIFINHCDFIQDKKVFDYGFYFLEKDKVDVATSPVSYNRYRKRLLSITPI